MQPQGHLSAISPLQRLLIVVVGLVGLLLLGFVTVQALTFHIVKTDPKLSAVGNYSPFLKVYFNAPLDSKNLDITSDTDIIKNTTASDKVLTITLNQTLTVGQHYTITLNRVTDTKGRTITNKRLSFTAKDIPINDLSDTQQKAIVGNQDKYPYTVYTIPFTNFDTLTDNGLTSDQEQVVKQALYDYSVSVNQKFKGVSLDTSSLKVAPYDPNSADLSHNLTFSVNADGTKYNLSVTYTDLTTAHVVITDVTGTTVFDNANS